jgi:hypothetical protein
VAGYTAVNLLYRKPGPAYRPYQDAQDRATTARLLAAGWHKLPVRFHRPVEKPALDGEAATVKRAAAGLGPDLTPQFAEAPKLLASIDRVLAPVSVAHGADCTAFVTASLGDPHAQLGEFSLYRKGHELVLVPVVESLPGRELMSRWSDSTYLVTFPTASLPPGRYEVRVVANGPAAAWSFTLR